MRQFPESDRKSRQPIIQWHGQGEERPQKNFATTAESIHLTGSNIVKSKENYFYRKVGSGDECASSFKIRRDAHKSYTKPTDIFLYGHSTFREYVTPKSRVGGLKKEVRGISIDHSYVSAGKVVDYVSNVFPNAMAAANPVRVWLMSCHTAYNDLDDAGELYGKSFAEKLSVKGWRNARVIGFEEPVNYFDTLPKARDLAENTPLYSRLRFPASVDRLGPHIWGIDDHGTVSSRR